MFAKGILSFTNKIFTRNTSRFFSTMAPNNCFNRLKELFPNHSVISLQEGHVLFGYNRMKLTEATLALRNPEHMEQFIKKNEVPISELRQFTIKKNLDEVIQVDDRVFVPFEYVKPYREINDQYLNLFKSDNTRGLGLS